MAGAFQSPITINEAMQKIRKREYLLPAFQREYVWKPEQIEKLFDSLMRGYPINSMLFWKINGETKSKWKFYDFLQYFRPPHHTHNEFFETKGLNVFEAILDGQQRLTSLYLALFGHYDIGKNYTQWKNKNEEKFFKKCHFYFNLNSSRENNEELDIVFEFRWCDKDLTQEKIVFCDSDKKWFKIGEFYNEKYGNEKERNLSVRRISREFNLSESEETNLSLLYNKIFEDKTINFYSEDDENPDKAVNIFIRINSGGKPLDYSDILFSIAVANWKNRDAKGEINNLVDNINNLGFNIKKDLILKGFLFIFHDNIQFQINSFDKGFVEFIEEKWESIRDCFVEIFKLLRNFGLEAKTLPSVNSVLPILYFTYHNNLTGQIVDSVTQKQNRELIKKWLMRVVILKPLGGSGDAVLTNMRKAFIKDFKQNDKKYFDETLELFPLKQIEREAKYSQTIDDEYLEDNIIYSRKNSAEAFSVLSLLYPDLDYKNGNFHRDHLHPEAQYKEYEQIGNKKHNNNPDYEYWDFSIYDSLPNLQMLDANENMKKRDKSLQEWVEENYGNDKDFFLKRHLIPADIDLSLENFDEFYEARKKLLKDKLKEILN